VTPRFRLKERLRLLPIFQTLLAHRIHILRALVTGSAQTVGYITLCGHPLEPGRDLKVSEEEVYLVG